MISVFLREQKRYTQEDLVKEFRCSEEKTVRILKRLKEYGVLKLKNMYGKKYLGIERSTFVINELGILTHEYRKVNSKTHVDQLIKDLGV